LHEQLLKMALLTDKTAMRQNPVRSVPYKAVNSAAEEVRMGDIQGTGIVARRQ